MIEYGDEKLYCPVCKSVLIRKKYSEWSFICTKCPANWMIVDEDAKFVLTPPIAGIHFQREPITEIEKKKKSGEK